MENSFKKSESITKLATAMGMFQGEMVAVKKDASNPFYKSKYATLESIIESIKDPMKKAKLSYVQLPAGENLLVTVLMHESGEFMESTVKMAPKDNTPQGQGSAITYMRRYALSAMLGLATEDDDDGNAATKPKEANKTTEPVASKTDPLFEKAKKNLSANTDKAQLEDFKKKIEGSKKYTPEQKKELIDVIDGQLKKAK